MPQTDPSPKPTSQEMRSRAAHRSRALVGPWIALAGAIVVGYMEVSGYLGRVELVLNVFLLAGLAISPIIASRPRYRTSHAIYVISMTFLLFIYSALASNGVMNSGLPVLIMAQLAAGIYLGLTGIRVATSVLLAYVVALVVKLIMFPSAAELAAPAAQTYGRVILFSFAVLATHWITSRYVLEQIELLRRLKRSNEHKSAFLANMSHEIRTPLNGILGMAQAMDMRSLDPDVRGMVNTMLDAGRSLTTVLDDILDLSKIEAGKLTISPTAGDLSAVIESLAVLWTPNATEKGLALTLDIDPDIPDRLSFDSVRVRQCVSNLLSNAIKFTETGSVTLAAKLVSDEVDNARIEISVTDTGIGMDAETLDRLFRPFEQGDESTTRNYGGTGLGLSISQALAGMMGGDLAASSVEGDGSRFTLTLVAAVVAQAETEAELDEDGVGKPSRMRGRSILLVDDVATNRLIAKLFLEEGGASVAEAENGQEALDKLRDDHFDLVLMDWHMPVMDGPTALAQIRAAREPWSAVPVLALTADVVSDGDATLDRAAFDGFVPKPIERSTLCAEIDRVLAAGDVRRAG